MGVVLYDMKYFSSHIQLLKWSFCGLFFYTTCTGLMRVDKVNEGPVSILDSDLPYRCSLSYDLHPEVLRGAYFHERDIFLSSKYSKCAYLWLRRCTVDSSLTV